MPVDGTVLEGNSSVDEAAITGESVPVEKQVGDKVVSATMNKSGFLKCRADKVGDDTTLSQIIRLVEEASASKAPIAQLADKVAGVFVPMVICIALITLIGWLLAGAEAEFAISTAIAVLVISCPCALGLATPVAIMVGTGVGAKNGILIKSGEALQQAQEINTVVLDKTGTITEGKLEVNEVLCVEENITKAQVLALAGALEQKSEHPLAEAVVIAAEGKGMKDLGTQGTDKLLASCQVKDFKAVFGKGIQGVVAADWLQGQASKAEAGEGKVFYIGNKAFLEEKQVSMTKEAMEQINALADGGQTPLLVADDKKLWGVIGVSDQIKESSREAIAAWHDMGVKVIMLTGDNKTAGETVAKELGMDQVYTELLPDGKVEKVESLLKELPENKTLAFVGDGINDAPVLALSDVGIAMGGVGSDAAVEAADIVIMTDEPSKIPAAVKICRRTLAIVKQNIVFALGIKFAVLLLGAFGFATMWEAVFADVGVAVIAVLNSIRALRTH